MRLTINGKVYEIDRAPLEQRLVSDGMQKLLEVEKQAPPMLHGVASNAVNMVMAFLGRKHPELRKPDDVPAIPFAAQLIAKLLLDGWEKNGLVIEAREVGENEPDSN